MRKHSSMQKWKIMLIMGIFLAIAIVLIVVVLVTHSGPKKYSELIAKYSKRYSVDEALVYAVIKCESNFDTFAVSGAGACGLMQLMPNTAQEISKKLHVKYNANDLFRPEVNIMFGCYYLGYLQSLYSNLECVLSAYNAGLGNVNLWLSNPEYSDDGVTLKHIPFKETRNYVASVTKYFEKYKNSLQ